MNYLYFYLLAFFVVLNIINFIFLLNKDKYKKTSFTIGVLSLLFSTIIIIIMNINYNSLIFKEFSDVLDKKLQFLNIVRDLNIFFATTSLITTLILAIISYKLNYKLLYIMTIISLLILTIILFFYKGIIITKSVINLSLLSWCLMNYYLNFAIIPLLIKKCKN